MNDKFSSRDLVSTRVIGHTRHMIRQACCRYRHLRRMAALAMLLVPGLAAARPALYRYDTVHSQILFSIDHNGYSRPFGRLHIASGWLRFDPDNWPASATELDIDLSGVDMGDAAWNAAVRGADFLDTGKAAQAHFVSTSVERHDASHGLLHGLLTLRGVSHPVDLAFTANRVGKTIYGLHTVAGFSATASLRRADFGMRSNPYSIGQSVNLWFELEAIRDDGPASPTSTRESP